MQDDVTPNRSYPLPFPGDDVTPSNTLQEDAGRLRDALLALDDDIASMLLDLTLRAPLASPALTGSPTAPTAEPGTNTTQLATTAFVRAAVAALLASAPAALDTLNELAAALGNDPDFSTTIINALAGKAPLDSPHLTGTPTAPTAALGTSTAQVASTEFVQDTLEDTLEDIHLLGGSPPGPGRLYGTNAAGDRGWLYAGLRGITPRTSNTALAASDADTVIRVTSAGFTQTFTAAATLGAGWTCVVWNDSTGELVYDPSGSETIDGLTSFIGYPGEMRRIFCDGTGFTSIVIRPFHYRWTAGGSFTMPPGYYGVEGYAWGGGGSGQKSDGASFSRGGSGGAGPYFRLLASQIVGTKTITIGAGGAAVSTASTNGNNGGDTSLDTLVVAKGGSGGASPNAPGGLAPGDQATNSAIYSGATSNASGGPGPSSTFGGPAGGGVTSGGVANVGGDSALGSKGGNGATTTSGTAGQGPGAGGGATRTGATSGAGADGAIEMWGTL